MQEWTIQYPSLERIGSGYFLVGCHQDRLTCNALLMPRIYVEVVRSHAEHAIVPTSGIRSEWRMLGNSIDQRILKFRPTVFVVFTQTHQSGHFLALGSKRESTDIEQKTDSYVLATRELKLRTLASLWFQVVKAPSIVHAMVLPLQH